MVHTVTNKSTAKHSSIDLAISSRNELPLINSNNDYLVDAKSLHQRLGIKTKFQDWFERQIKSYGFQSEIDFFSNLRKSTGGRKATEYHLTLDMAKEICMVERSEIGRAFRRYFIEAEKELRTKRLYAATSTITEVSKAVKPYQLNGRKMFELRKVRQALGFSCKNNTTGIKKQYPGLIVLWDNRLYVSEEYVRVLMSRAKTRALHEEARAAKPVLPENFGQLPLGLEAKYGK